MNGIIFKETLLYLSKDVSVDFASVCVESPACIVPRHSVFPKCSRR